MANLVRSQAMSVYGVGVPLVFLRVIGCCLSTGLLGGCCNCHWVVWWAMVVRKTVQGTGDVGLRCALHWHVTSAWGYHCSLPVVESDCRVACAKWARQWLAAGWVVDGVSQV